MNIFVTSADVNECAQMLDDVRLRKMIQESCQMLSTAMRKQLRQTGDMLTRLGQVRPNYMDCLPIEYVPKTGTYKQILDLSAYANHPCTVWTGKHEHFTWHVRLLIAMLDEHIYRFDKRSLKAEAKLVHFANHLTSFYGGSSKSRPIGFANCTPYKEDQFPTVFEAYRQTMRDKWANDIIRVTWTRRNQPNWR